MVPVTPNKILVGSCVVFVGTCKIAVSSWIMSDSDCYLVGSSRIVVG